MTRRLHAAYLSVRRKPPLRWDLRKSDNGILLSCFPNVAGSNPIAGSSLVCLALINYWLRLWHLNIVGGTILEHQQSILSIMHSLIHVYHPQWSDSQDELLNILESMRCPSCRAHRYGDGPCRRACRKHQMRREWKEKKTQMFTRS